jgi:methylated-DNA-[protein]-cysteine S-methyltransferase
MRAWIARHYPRAAVQEGQGPLQAVFARYFAGEVDAFDGVAWAGAGTAFQKTVWDTLCTIPAGETWSYAQLAERIGRPTAVRAVGLANGSNPVALIVPCHRVIGSNGSLTGYGGGLHRKRWLLEHEGALAKVA